MLTARTSIFYVLFYTLDAGPKTDGRNAGCMELLEVFILGCALISTCEDFPKKL